ncbi:MAG: glycine--tRNA ligase [Deltaproteobacteria bacterium]|nr:MAG: glycine--tRNA ligase [Deltaproteobacteria bacterium]
MPRPTGPALMEKLVALCKRRGFIFPASEIYGGINGFWDYGPLGAQLKNNLRDAWWRDMVEVPPLGPDGEPLQIVGLDSSIIQNPKVWEASGHVGGFNDPMVDCRESKRRYRADHLHVFLPSDGEGPGFAFVEGEADTALSKIKKAKRDRDQYRVTPLLSLDPAAYAGVIGPDTKEPGSLTEPRQFNLMFQTYVGATATQDNLAYLRPETAQGIFLNFKNVLDSSRVAPPFGIAQIGKAFRNEVTPRNFIFRSREFEQMEMEWFCHSSEAVKWFEFWSQARLQWWKDQGVQAERLILRTHERDELAHYAKKGAGTVDIEYAYPFTEPGHGELEGVAHRSCYDLTQHQEHSNKKLEFFDPQTRERYLPDVIEPAAGLSRGVLVLLADAYDLDESRPSPELLRLKPSLAPVKAGIFPLTKKDGLPEISDRIFRELRERYVVQHDIKQSIGKRYARMDEIGTPFCITVDHQTLEDQTVTVRDRDTGYQQRIATDKLTPFLAEKL